LRYGAPEKNSTLQIFLRRAEKIFGAPNWPAEARIFLRSFKSGRGALRARESGEKAGSARFGGEKEGER
jgi:hypothetical protein